MLGGCRPLHEGVDWNTKLSHSFHKGAGRPLHEGVDWNYYTSKKNLGITVALFTRAWIEIPLVVVFLSWFVSRPLHEGVDWNETSKCKCFPKLVALFTRAWIEIFAKDPYYPLCLVALFTRAWIEIFWLYRRLWRLEVALFTRAWIEIYYGLLQIYYIKCRPLHEGVDWNNGNNWQIFSRWTGRPLHEGVDWNHIALDLQRQLQQSPSSRGRGLKFPLVALGTASFASPSSRGRGLKLLELHGKLLNKRSPSSRGRGLKSTCNDLNNILINVALFTRAWIEI